MRWGEKTCVICGRISCFNIVSERIFTNEYIWMVGAWESASPKKNMDLREIEGTQKYWRNGKALKKLKTWVGQNRT